MKNSLNIKETVRPSSQYKKICWSVLRALILFSFISNLLMLALPVYSLQVMDRVISTGSTDTLIMLTLVAAGSLIILSLIQTARSYATIQLGDWLEGKLAPIIFGQTLRNATTVKSATNSQSIRDLGTMKSFLSGPLLAAVFDAPWSLIFIIALFAIHSLIGIITITAGLLLLALALIGEYSTKNILKAAGIYSTENLGQLEMAARNAEVIEAMGMQKNISRLWLGNYKLAAKFSSEAGKKLALTNNLSRFIRYFLQIAIIGTTGYLTLENEVTAGAIVASSILLGRALAPLESIIGAWANLVSVREAYNRLITIIDNQTSRDEEINLPTPDGRIEADNLTFIPGNNKKPILKGISFKIAPGEMLGIIGPSGSGKSTLAKLITGIWKPTYGTVRMDGAETFRWNRENFGRHIGYLPQDIELFSGTVKENIARMNMDAKNEDIMSASEKAGVHQMILKLLKGYETNIGMEGATLSGGQKQRIGIARAFYGNPKVILLDEPNSNLDSEGENALIKAVTQAKKDKVTIIMITHKPSLLAQADKIMLLREGEISSFGKKEEIFAKFNVINNENPEKKGNLAVL